MPYFCICLIFPPSSHLGFFIWGGGGNITKWRPVSFCIFFWYLFPALVLFLLKSRTFKFYEVQSAFVWVVCSGSHGTRTAHSNNSALFGFFRKCWRLCVWHTHAHTRVYMHILLLEGTKAELFFPSDFKHRPCDEVICVRRAHYRPSPLCN